MVILFQNPTIRERAHHLAKATTNRAPDGKEEQARSDLRKAAQARRQQRRG